MNEWSDINTQILKTLLSKRDVVWKREKPRKNYCFNM